MDDATRKAADAFQKKHPKGGKALLAELGQPVVVRDDPNLGKPTYHSNPPVDGGPGPFPIERPARVRKPKAQAPTHPRLLALMQPTGKPKRGHGPVTDTEKAAIRARTAGVRGTVDAPNVDSAGSTPAPVAIPDQSGTVVGQLLAWQADDIALAAELAGEPVGTVVRVNVDEAIESVLAEMDVIATEMEAAAAPTPTVAQQLTREGWMLRAVELLAPRFAAAGSPIPEVRVSIGWPGGRGSKQNVVGQCWMSPSVEDGKPAIFVSPRQHDPVEILSTILHELVHATGIYGHTAGKFGALGKQVGLSAPWATTPDDAALKAELGAMAAQLGPFGHSRVKSNDMKGTQVPGAELDGPPVQGTRMLKLVCGQPHAAQPELDGYSVRTTKKWIEAGTPLCPAGHDMVSPDGAKEEDNE